MFLLVEKQNGVCTFGQRNECSETSKRLPKAKMKRVFFSSVNISVFFIMTTGLDLWSEKKVMATILATQLMSNQGFATVNYVILQSVLSVDTVEKKYCFSHRQQDIM